MNVFFVIGIADTLTVGVESSRGESFEDIVKLIQRMSVPVEVGCIESQTKTGGPNTIEEFVEEVRVISDASVVLNAVMNLCPLGNLAQFRSCFDGKGQEFLLFN